MSKSTKVTSLKQARLDSASETLKQADPNSVGVLALNATAGGDRLEIQCDAETDTDGLLRIAVIGSDGKVKSCHYIPANEFFRFAGLCEESLNRKDAASERVCGCA